MGAIRRRLNDLISIEGDKRAQAVVIKVDTEVTYSPRKKRLYTQKTSIHLLHIDGFR